MIVSHAFGVVHFEKGERREFSAPNSAIENALFAPTNSLYYALLCLRMIYSVSHVLGWYPSYFCDSVE